MQPDRTFRLYGQRGEVGVRESQRQQFLRKRNLLGNLGLL